MSTIKFEDLPQDFKKKVTPLLEELKISGLSFDIQKRRVTDYINISQTSEPKYQAYPRETFVVCVDEMPYHAETEDEVIELLIEFKDSMTDEDCREKCEFSLGTYQGSFAF